MRLVLVAILLVPTPALAGGGLPISVGGYLQPQFRLRDNSVADDDQDGFRFRRGRFIAKAERERDDLTFGATLELDVSPDVALMDGYVSVGGPLPKDGDWKIDLGQVKAPFSRQALLSDANLQFVEKAELSSLAPDRQIGGRARVAVPGVPMASVWGGVFNGEGRNRTRNVDEHYLWVARVEISPIGRAAPLEESGFVDHVTIGGGVTRNTLDLGDVTEKQTGLGVDVSAAWKGISAAFEYTHVQHDFSSMAQDPYVGQGFAAQAGYLLPLGGYFDRHFEVSARVEEIDRNDTVFVDLPGDPNQSLRLYTGGLTYYHAQHDLKAQVTASHVQEVETETRTGDSLVVDNDVVLIQLTARME